jgi:peptide/nickel transport system permease protein
MATISGPSSGGTEFSEGIDAGFTDDGAELPPGIGPWSLAWRRLRRNKTALFFGVLFLVLVVLCLLAPVYSHDIAHIGPNTENITGTIKEGGKQVDVVSLTDIPIGPTWSSHYFFGADEQGRDTAVRLLYGGRTSLEVGVIAMLLTMVLATVLGLMAGYFRGAVDGVVSRVMDVIWAFPAVLLGIALGVALNVRGFLFLKSTTPITTAAVVGFVYIPYVYRPIRAQVLTLREREFVDAARQQGLSSTRIIAGEILPNVASTVLVFIPLMLANAILFEAALSYLGAGIQPPNASWGTMIASGLDSIPVAFSNVLVPGIMLVLTVLSVNVFGDGLRDALDPRAKIRVGG